MADGKMVPQTWYAPKVSKGAARFRPTTLGSNGSTALPPAFTDAEAPQLPAHQSRVRHSFRDTRWKPEYYFMSSQCYGLDSSAEPAGKLKAQQLQTPEPTYPDH